MKETLGFELKMSPSFFCSLLLLRFPAFCMTRLMYSAWAFIASPASKVGLPTISIKSGSRLQSTSQDLLAVNSSLVMSPKKCSWPSNRAVHSPHMIRGGAYQKAQMRQEEHDFYGGFILAH